MLRFLQRAASNFQQEFNVVVPSTRLPINSRRTILAAQLRDFVHIYNAVRSLSMYTYRISTVLEHLENSLNFVNLENSWSSIFCLEFWCNKSVYSGFNVSVAVFFCCHFCAFQRE